jgi:peptidoglycan/LPS O-acetylase OafA/YrhL
MHPKYRPDIDGLRAIAVLSVMMYHAFPAALRGGFVGVDIFFVISGFLICTIIFKGLESNQFSFIDFYSRRVRRIFPALVAVLLTTFVLGWFILYQDEYRQLGKHIAGSAGFVSNFVLWRESGYFDAAAETKPLLHIWSLGIEEQFYIVFPMLAWLLWRARLNALSVVILLGVISFALNLKSVGGDAAMTFYMPQTRAWELSIGSTLALLALDLSGGMAKLEASPGKLLRRLCARQTPTCHQKQFWQNARAWLGVLLISVALWKITRDTYFPGQWALLPTLGAAFLIWAGPHAYVNRALLSSRILVWVGKISYPLYLWHWVLLTYTRIVVGETPSVGVRCAALGLAILLAWLSYSLIEKPLRFGGNSRRKTLALAIAMSAIACVGLACFKTNSPSSWFFAAHSNRVKETNELVAALQTRLKQWQDPKTTVQCFQLRPDKDFKFFADHGCIPPTQIDRANAPTLMLIGDSFSASLSLGLRPWAAERGYKFYQISSGSCSLFSDDVSDPDCQNYTRKSFEAIPFVKPDVLIIDSYWLYASQPAYFKNQGNWPSYSEYLTDKFRYIAGLQAKKVIVVGQIPIWDPDLPHQLIRNFIANGQRIPHRTFLGVTRGSLTMDATMRTLAFPPNYHYFSMKDVLCNADGCLTRVGNNLATDLAVWDYGHLTEPAARYVVSNGLGDLISLTLKER